MTLMNKKVSCETTSKFYDGVVTEVNTVGMFLSDVTVNYCGAHSSEKTVFIPWFVLSEAIVIKE
jgi:hypothetical protein